jgi:hypothetical protein
LNETTRFRNSVELCKALGWGTALCARTATAFTLNHVLAVRAQLNLADELLRKAIAARLLCATERDGADAFI